MNYKSTLIWKDEIRTFNKCLEEFSIRASAALLACPEEDILAWQVTPSPRMAYSLRATSISILSMILADLEGFWPNDEEHPENTRKSPLISLVCEARSTLIDCILGIPEIVYLAKKGGESQELLSVGGYDDSGISLQLPIPSEPIQSFYVPGVEDSSLAVYYWMLHERENRLSSLISHAQKKNGSFASPLTDFLEHEYERTYSEDEHALRARKHADGSPRSIVADEKLDEKTHELLLAALNGLQEIERLYPLTEASVVDMAKVCFQIAGVKSLPKWVG